MDRSSLLPPGALLALLGGLAVCHRPETGDTAETGDTGVADSGDTGEPDPCEHPPVPTPGWVNPDYDPSSCDFNGFPYETGYAIFRRNGSGIDGMAETLYRVDPEVQLYPNTIAFLAWWGDRGASLYPGEAFLTGESIQEAALDILVADVLTAEPPRSAVFYLSRSGRVYYSRGGLCNYYPEENRLVGFIDQVVLQEVDYDPDAGISEWIEGGRTWCIDRVDFDDPLN